MVADRGGELQCQVLSSHGVVLKWAELLCHMVNLAAARAGGSCARWQDAPFISLGLPHYFPPLPSITPMDLVTPIPSP